MLRLAASVLVIGLASALFAYLDPASAYAAVAQLGGLAALTLSMILGIVGTPSIRNLVG
jgi:hypothetical protein